MTTDYTAETMHWRQQRPPETAETTAETAETSVHWRLQRPLEMAETTGDCRDYWRLQRPLETAETTGDGRDHWRLRRLLQTAETTGDVYVAYYCCMHTPAPLGSQVSLLLLLIEPGGLGGYRLRQRIARVKKLSQATIADV